MLLHEGRISKFLEDPIYISVFGMCRGCDLLSGAFRQQLTYFKHFSFWDVVFVCSHNVVVFAVYSLVGIFGFLKAESASLWLKLWIQNDTSRKVVVCGHKIHKMQTVSTNPVLAIKFYLRMFLQFVDHERKNVWTF